MKSIVAGIVAGLVVSACPAPTPPSPPGTPPVVFVGDAGFLTPTRSNAAVLSDLQRACGYYGGMMSVELAHAQADRKPVWDCLFDASGSAGKCGCP